MTYFAILCIGALYRYYLIFGKFDHFSSDTAVMCLIAKHIMQGVEYPFLFTGHSYIGAFPAYVLSLFFHVFDPTLMAFKAYTLVVSMLFYGIVIVFANATLNKRTTLFLSLILMCPPYSFITIPGYCVYHLFMVYIAVFFCVTYRFHKKPSNFLFYLLGFMCGLGFYLHPMFLYCIAFFSALLIFKQFENSEHENIQFISIEKIILWCFCFFVGSIPYWIGLEQNWIYYNPFSKYLTSNFNNISGATYLFTDTFPNLFGFDINNMILKYFVIMIYACSYLTLPYYFIRYIKQNPKPIEWVISLFFIIVLGVFLFAFSISEHPTRHLIPLCFVTPFAIVFMLKSVAKKSLFPAILIIFVLLVYNVYTVISAPVPDKDYSELQQYLIDKNLTRGYADFWLTYKFIFLTDEQIILSPIYGVDRYEPYTHQVVQGINQFYLFDYDDEKQKEMCDIFEQTIQSAGIFFKKDFCNEFVIFHSLNMLWNKEILPIKYFRPIYEEYLQEIPEDKNFIHKILKFQLALPSNEYLLINNLYTPTASSYPAKTRYGNFQITSVPDQTVICSKDIFPDSFNQSDNAAFSIKTYLPKRKLFTFSMFTQDKRSQWRYICIL